MIFARWQCLKVNVFWLHCSFVKKCECCLLCKCCHVIIDSNTWMFYLWLNGCKIHKWALFVWVMFLMSPLEGSQIHVCMIFWIGHIATGTHWKQALRGPFKARVWTPLVVVVTFVNWGHAGKNVVMFDQRKTPSFIYCTSILGSRFCPCLATTCIIFLTIWLNVFCLNSVKMCCYRACFAVYHAFSLTKWEDKENEVRKIFILGNSFEMPSPIPTAPGEKKNPVSVPGLFPAPQIFIADLVVVNLNWWVCMISNKWWKCDHHMIKWVCSFSKCYFGG